MSNLSRRRGGVKQKTPKMEQQQQSAEKEKKKGQHQQHQQQLQQSWLSLSGVLQRLTASENTRDAMLLSVVHLNVLIYALSYWMQQPLLPFIVSSLGADRLVFGYLQTTVSLLALVSGPVIGALMDRVGVKSTLVLSQLGSAMCYLTLSLSFNVSLLFISRIFTVSQAVMQTAQACVAQQLRSERSDEAMGRLSMSYGIGMVVGSSLGGFIADRWSLAMSGYISTCLSVSIAVIDACVLPNKPRNDSIQESSSMMINNNNEKRKDSFFNHRSVWMDLKSLLIGNPTLQKLIFFMFAVVFGPGLFRSSYPLFLKESLKMDPSGIGNYISFCAVISTLTNSLLVGWLQRSLHLSELRIVQLSCFVTAACFAAIALVFHHDSPFMSEQQNSLSVMIVYIVAVPQSIAAALLYLLLTGLIKSSVNTDQMGKAIAMSHSIRSMVSVIAPTLAVSLMEFAGFSSVAMVSAASVLLSVSLISVSEFSSNRPTKSPSAED